MWRNGNPYTLLVDMCNGGAATIKTVWKFLKKLKTNPLKLKIELRYDSAVILLNIYPKELKLVILEMILALPCSFVVFLCSQ